MANYEKRGDRIRARVTVPNSGGRRETKTFDTKREARRWAEQIEDGDAVVPVEKRTLNDLADLYLREEVPNKRNDGVKFDVNRIKFYRERFPALFAKTLHEIRRQDIEALIDIRLTEVKSSSVNRDLNLISSMMTHARRIEWMTNNPFDSLRRPKSPAPRDRRITTEEITQILTALGYREGVELKYHRHRVAVAFLLAIETAMRCGEMCKIRWIDVHLDERWLFLPGENTKTMQPRKIPLSPEAIRLINLLPRDGDLILGISVRSLDAEFRKARDKTDIVDLHFHDTRHEATTRLASKVHVLDLARITGHSDIKQLQTYYNRDARELADLLA